MFCLVCSPVAMARCEYTHTRCLWDHCIPVLHTDTPHTYGVTPHTHTHHTLSHTTHPHTTHTTHTPLGALAHVRLPDTVKFEAADTVVSISSCVCGVRGVVKVCERCGLRFLVCVSVCARVCECGTWLCCVCVCVCVRACVSVGQSLTCERLCHVCACVHMRARVTKTHLKNNYHRGCGVRQSRLVDLHVRVATTCTVVS